MNNRGLQLPEYFVFVVIMSASVASAIGTVRMANILEAAYEERMAMPEVQVREPTLPEICAPLYNNGTEDWITCMGVGYK